MTKTTSFPLIFVVLALFACAKPVPPFEEGSTRTGYASWYGDEFHGRPTASGEIYDMDAFTAAHRSAPFGTRVEVLNLVTGKSAVVRIIDRGPFVRGRIIDLSRAAAAAVGLIGSGTARVRLTFLSPATPDRAPPAAEAFVLQAGSFRERPNAARYLLDLTRAYGDLPFRIEEEGGFFRIFAGPFTSGDAADRARQRLEKDGRATLLLRRP